MQKHELFISFKIKGNMLKLLLCANQCHVIDDDDDDDDATSRE